MAEFMKRWEPMLPKRLEHSRLAAFWTTEIGPLNQVIHVWEYKDVAERTRIREERGQGRHLAAEDHRSDHRHEVGDHDPAAVLAAAGTFQLTGPTSRCAATR